MLHRPVLLGFSLLITVLSQRLDAQTVTPGDRVRVHFTEYQLVMVGNTARRDSQTVELIGVLDRLQADSLYVEQDRSENSAEIPLTDLTMFEVSRGRRNNTVKGMAVGTAFGFGVGFLAGFLTCSDGACAVSGAEAGLIYGGIGAGMGLLLGVAIGAATSGERWEVVPLMDLQVTLDGHGLALRIPIPSSRTGG